MLLALILAVTLPSTPVDHIHDGAQLLSTAGRHQVADFIQKVELQQQVALGVVTLEQLDEDAKAVAVRALNDWQMGPRSVLLLISLNPRKIYLQPGNAFQAQFSEALASAIARDKVAPELRAKRFESALLAGLSAASLRVSVEPPAPVPRQALAPTPLAPAEPSPDGPGMPKSLKWLLLFVSGASAVYGSVSLLKRRKARKEREAERAAKDLEQSAKRESAEITATVEREMEARRAAELEWARWRTDPKRAETEHVRFGSRGGVVVPPPPVLSSDRNRSAPAPAPVVVVQDSGSTDFLTGMLVADALSRPAPAPAPSYTPPPPAPTPRYEPPRRADTPAPSPSFSSDSGGGGGSDWGSSSSSSDSGGSSDGGGGGGSDW